MPRIFERFFSSRPDSDRRAHMGLGLAIARAVIEAHGGSIAARNRSGGGAEFEVRLPAADAATLTGEHDRPAVGSPARRG